MKRHIAKSTAGKLVGISYLARWIGFLFALSLMVVFNYAAAATASVQADAAPIDPVLTNEKFDHAKTAFNLTGAHYTARCVSCHINNILKGTPRECAGCHVAGNRMSTTAKPVNHILTNAQCDNCHKTTLWTPALFSHVGIVGTCNTCHNGSTATGKPRAHMVTNSSCDACHKTTDWLQAVFSHKGIVNGCSTCHGQTFQGMTPVAKPNNHMQTSADCSDCHITTSFVTLKPGALIPLPSGHFPTTQQCGACHLGASFLPGIMNHTGITGNCESCHNGTAWLGTTPRSKVVPPHMATNLPCASCHTTGSTFSLSTTAILPMPAGHLPSLKPCSTCHIAGFGPGSGLPMQHTGIVNDCASCHNGQSFSVGQGVSPLSKSTGPSGHIPTSTACESCHSVNNTLAGGFNLGIMNHSGITSNCSSCHSDGMSFAGVTPKRKQDATNHVGTTQDCSSCHSSTTTFAGASGGVLPAGHMPTTQPCSICHSAGYGLGLTAMTHAGIANNCNACHNGQTFTVNGVSVTPMRKQDDPTPPHIDTALDCSSCHTSTATFTGAISTVVPANHLPTTRTCTTCHSPGSVAMSHSGIVDNCSQCHNGQSFYGNGSTTGLKPVSKASFSTHVATTSDCSVCHYPSPNGYTSFAGASGGALPLNHLTTSQPCTVCHTQPPPNTFGSNSGVMNHIGILSGCSSCHSGQTFAVGMRPMSKATNHLPTGSSCEMCHSASSTSAGGFAGATMSHAGIVNGCAGCHSGNTYQGGVAPVSKSGTHVPVSATRPTGGDKCETCHSVSNFSTFVGAPMRHTGITTNCVECHGKVGAPKPYIGPPRYEPSNHIPYATQLLNGGTLACEFCHKSTTAFTLGASSTTMHNGSQGKGSGWCVGCHKSGTSYLGVRGRKSLTHEKSGHTDCSDSGCHRPLGNEGSAYNSW